MRWNRLLFLLLLAGLGAAVVSAQDLELMTMRYDGLPRTYALYLPPQYDGETLLPVVFVLHGGGGNAANADTMTGFREKAAEEGFIVVYPNGTGPRRQQGILLTWNAGFCCASARDNDVDDVGFFAALIDDLLATYAIDPERVYVTGMSNGAMMSNRLGGALSERIAAIATVAGAVGGQQTPDAEQIMTESPTQPVHVLMVNATDDIAVPYEGGQTSLGTAGEEFVVVSVEDSLAFWQEVNACIDDPTINVLVTNIATQETYNCESGADVSLITLTEGGHSWPGSERVRPRADEPTQAIDATDVIWDFFAAHPKVTGQ